MPSNTSLNRLGLLLAGLIVIGTAAACTQRDASQLSLAITLGVQPDYTYPANAPGIAVSIEASGTLATHYRATFEVAVDGGAYEAMPVDSASEGLIDGSTVHNLPMPFVSRQVVWNSNTRITGPASVMMRVTCADSDGNTAVAESPLFSVDNTGAPPPPPPPPTEPGLTIDWTAATPGGVGAALTAELEFGETLAATIDTTAQTGQQLDLTISVIGGDITAAQAGFSGSFPLQDSGDGMAQVLLAGTASMVGTLVLQVSADDAANSLNTTLTLTVTIIPGLTITTPTGPGLIAGASPWNTALPVGAALDFTVGASNINAAAIHFGVAVTGGSLTASEAGFDALPADDDAAGLATLAFTGTSGLAGTIELTFTASDISGQAVGVLTINIVDQPVVTLAGTTLSVTGSWPSYTAVAFSSGKFNVMASSATGTVAQLLGTVTGGNLTQAQAGLGSGDVVNQSGASPQAKLINVNLPPNPVAGWVEVTFNVTDDLGGSGQCTLMLIIDTAPTFAAPTASCGLTYQGSGLYRNSTFVEAGEPFFIDVVATDTPGEEVTVTATLGWLFTPAEAGFAQSFPDVVIDNDGSVNLHYDGATTHPGVLHMEFNAVDVYGRTASTIYVELSISANTPPAVVLNVPGQTGGPYPDYTRTISLGHSLGSSIQISDSDCDVSVTMEVIGGSITAAAAGLNESFPISFAGTSPQVIALSGVAATTGTVDFRITADNVWGGNRTLTLQLILVANVAPVIAAPVGPGSVIDDGGGLYHTSVVAGDALDFSISATDGNAWELLAFSHGVSGSIASLAAAGFDTFIDSDLAGVSTRHWTGIAQIPGTLVLDFTADDGVAQDTARLTITITAGPPVVLVYTTQPPDEVDTDAVLAPAIVVEIRDALGNVCPINDNADIALLKNPASATLGGTTTRAFVNGVVSFDDLTVDTSAAGCSLHVSCALGPPPVESFVFDVLEPGAPMVPTVEYLTLAQGADGMCHELSYGVRHALNERVDVLVEYDALGDDTWVRCSQAPADTGSGVSRVRTSGAVGGRAHIFFWDSELDLPQFSGSNVGVRVTPILDGVPGNGMTLVSQFVSTQPRLDPPDFELAGNAVSWVASADINRDGYADLVVCNTDDDTVSVILHDSANPGSWLAATDIATGDAPRRVRVADIDMDGRLDLVTAGDGGLHVHWQQADGTFVDELLFNDPISDVAIGLEGPAQRPLTLVGVRVADGQLKLAQQTSPGTFGSPFARAATSAGVQALLLADFDRDGLVDVAVTDVAANEIVILHRDDSAWNLTEAQRCAVASTPADLVAVDLLRRARLDLVVACSGSADASILFADDATPGQFLAATALATAGSGSASVVAGDIDADGKPDLLFAHPADSLVTVALQARETPGNFDLTLPFVLDAPVALGLADLDRDGRPDLLAATNQPSGRVLLRRNTTPHACRSPLAERVCGQVAAAVVVDDFNADGRPDLLRVTDGVLWLGRGDASLRLSTTLLASYTYSRLIAADLNQDGLPDVIATSSSPWTLRVFLNLSGNPGQFTLAQETSDFPQNLSAIAVGDITNDGVPDLVYGSNSNNVVVYEGAGDGTFIETAWATLDSRIHANSLIVADLNDDDLLDIISYINSDLTILLQNTASPGTFITPAQWRTIPSGGLVVQLADLDNDGLIDIVNSGTGSSNDATWFRQNPASPGNFLATAVLLDRGSRTMLIRDLNDDNLPDLLFADYVALNEGGASFTDNGLSKKSGLTITFADVNGDGRDDVVYDSGALIALDSGLPPFSDRGIAAVSSYSNPTFPIVADLDRDGRPDIVSRLGDDDIGTTLQDPAGGFPVRVLTQLGNTTFAPHFAVGDVNGDGVPDLVLPRIGVSILPGDGAGNFPSNVTYAATLSTAVALADVNRDGHLDVLVSTTDDKLHVKFNIGNGTFAASVESAALDADLIAAGDMNGDGIPDAVTAHSSNKTVEVLLLADDGTVASQASTAIGGYIYAIELADLDRDGLLDLVISSDNTLVMFNDPASPGTLLAPVAIATSIGGSMALADMDRDGWLDVVLHSPSQPAAVVTLLLHQSDGSYRRETRDWLGGNTPINLAIGDIDRDGLPDAVCGTEGDMLVIPGSMDGRR